MSVVFHHYIGLLTTEKGTDSNVGWYLLFPNSVGHNAVILFFILSGFVLAIPAIDARPQPYPVFIIRRTFRIYLPYLAALLLAICGDTLFHGYITNSAWFHQFWSTSIDWHLVLQHIFFVGDYNTDQFNPPFWSLVYEMRISLIFPALCFLILKLRPKRGIVLAGALSVISQVIVLIHPTHSTVAYSETLHYAGLFVIGITIARVHDRLSESFNRASRIDQTVIAACSVILYAYGNIIMSGILSSLTKTSPNILEDWPTAVGAAGVILVSSSSQPLRHLLRWPPIHFLGKISYSLYLLHIIILLVLVHLFYGRFPLFLILTVCLPVTIAVSWAFYRIIEMPFLQLGRQLSENVGRSMEKSAHAEQA